jgi:hypothetical protein
MTLLEQYTQYLSRWEMVFAQERTLSRAVEVGLGLICGVGRRTITRSILLRGKGQEDWSADYKVFSRSPWDAKDLFAPIWTQALPDYCPEGPIAFGIDDTALQRTGKKIPTAFRQRDPMSPPFHPNLVWGQRFMQASLLLPLYEQDPERAPRALPVRFREAPVPKKPGRKATADQRQAYKDLRKTQNLSAYFVQVVQDLRRTLDAQGGSSRLLMAVGDGSFCNKRTFSAQYERTVLLSRCRKDLCLQKDRQKPQETFHPMEVLKEESIPWHKARIFYAGGWRTMEYKELRQVYWPRLGKKSPALRLLVIKPLPYQKSPHGPKELHEPGYLLCTDTETLSAEVLLQKYFDRWEVEVNHRDEKTVLGVGQAQVWNKLSTPRVPEFMVAMYSLLLLAGLACYGPQRTAVYEVLPKWRARAKRPSCLDLLTLLRRQLEAHKAQHDGIPLVSYKTMVLTAAA